ncbi:MULTISPECIES: sugar ABC transporter permease [unclassified Streptomyces]|uniref:carbohydrate ABC transporter permease n=1 Tax=Streptomyces TaxID=1883 RepID=UPI0001C18A46|nr:MULTISPECIES: sugar ABC transporter permease [unclassified Streptomyces]MYR68559.1 ABC transporter permease subunit [Streptomyces sp. SID4939]MYR99481.1 ABC transporter permease subunit [Streptomyces sp. SID4940]MYT64926.1 ABC transporter permease subunit [Streptomyces sp. SID8357]MYT87528.1 ABC transporter permease subunit [Streptomyces sp. SID8360]MYU35190.1 ABC transporter permease subunit [Streptomyces sp. SID8358]MYW36698.1 ABC transporter permease subunit [Streptomyces sp. SID1]
MTRAPRRRPYGVKSAPYAFLVPAAVLFLLFFALPIGYALHLSFRRTRVKGLGLGKGARDEIWAGLANYTDALSDSELLHGALRILGYGLIVVPVMLGLALLFALLLDTDRLRLRGFSRLAIFLPYAIPGVVSALMWGFLYLPDVSPFHFLLGKAGLPQPDLLDGGPLYLALANIAVWGGTGFNMIVIYTSLRAIPAEIFEAARLDGCSQLQIALRIKIPMVAPSLVLTFFFSIIATLQVFSEPTTLKPLTNSLSTTWSPLMKVYQDAFVDNDVHAAAAQAVIIALATLALSFGFLKAANSRTKQGDPR